MNTAELIRPPAAGHHASISASEQPSSREAIAEIVPLVGAVAGEGPPVIFLAAPWVLLALMLSGPFAFLVTLVAVMLVAATAAVAFIAAIFATPYLLVRRLRSFRAGRAVGSDRVAAPLVPVRSTRVAA